MKRLLYGTTALVAAGTLMAGPASAAGFEASLNGYMEQWFGFADNDNKNGGVPGGTKVQSVGMNEDAEVHFNASITLDNGMKVQYHVELEGETSGDQIDESYLRTTASWGQIVFGSENSASYLMAYGPNDFGITANSGDTNAWIKYPNAGITAAQAAAIGVAAATSKGSPDFRTAFGSRNTEVDVSCNDARRLTYFTPRFSGFQFGVSYTPNCGGEDGPNSGVGTKNNVRDVVSLGANFVRKFDQVDAALAVTYAFGQKPTGNAGDDPNMLHIGGKIGFGGFAVGGSWNKQFDGIQSGAAAAPASNETEGFQAGISYETGPWHFSAIYLYGERDGLVAIGGQDELQTVHVGLNYDLGPGVELRGTVGYADYDDEAGGTLDNDGWFLVGGMALSF